MDYEKKYNEALERAKEIKSKILYSHLSTESCKAVSEYIDTIIPELRESEDERIRKTIVATIEQCPDDFLNPKNRDKMLAYLERQKDQKPAWGEEDEKKIHFLSRLIEFQVKDGEYCFGEGACEISKQEAIEMLQSLRPQQKQEWSEEDEAMLDSVIRIITRFDDLAHEPTFAGPKWTHPYTKELNFLEKLRNRF